MNFTWAASTPDSCRFHGKFSDEKTRCVHPMRSPVVWQHVSEWLGLWSSESLTETSCSMSRHSLGYSSRYSRGHHLFPHCLSGLLQSEQWSYIRYLICEPESLTLSLTRSKKREIPDGNTLNSTISHLNLDEKSFRFPRGFPFSSKPHETGSSGMESVEAQEKGTYHIPAHASPEPNH